MWNKGTPEEKELLALRKAWFAAAKKNNVSAMKLMLAAGWNINEKDDGGRTALHGALLLRDAGLMGWLLEHGADPAVRGSDGLPAPHHWLSTARMGGMFGGLSAGYRYERENFCRAFDLILEKGFDVNLQDGNGDTLLHIAARRGAEAFIEERLLPFLPDADILNAERLTPLETALQGEQAAAADQIRKYISQAQQRKAPEPQSAQPAAQSEKPEERPAQTWRRLGDSEIARVSEQEAIGYCVTETFNFAAGLYIRVAQNMETEQESQVALGFSAMDGTDLLAAALKAFVDQGGTPPADGLPAALLKRSRAQIPGGM